MKKTVVLFLALVLMLSLVSCSIDFGDDSDVHGKVSDNEEEKGEDKEDKEEDTEKEAEKGGEEQKSSDSDFDIGKASGKTYRNEYLGIGITLDSGWTFYTDEEIAELNNIIIDEVDDEKIKESLKKSNSFYDAFAIDKSGSSLQIIFEKAIGYSHFSVEDYIDLVFKNGVMDSSVKQLENQGLSDIKAAKTEIKVDGKTLPGIEISGMFNGKAYKQIFVVLKKDSYFVSVVAASLGKTEEIIGKMYFIK